MAQRAVVLVVVCLFLVSTLVLASGKEGAGISRLQYDTIEQLHAAPHFASAEACTVQHTGDPYWLIQHWLLGAELYKTYQDPALSCSGPYPFSVEEVHMILYMEQPCTLYVSVDVETVDLSVAACPFPGDLLSISSEYMFVIPGEGLWQIAVPLDSAAVVNGPYFAGFYIANLIDTALGVCMVTDNSPSTCTDYNAWDPEVGYIDLADNDYFNFPGNIILFSTGTPGGGGPAEPAPGITLLKPRSEEIITGGLECWALEFSGSSIIDSVVFSYRGAGSWYRFASDADGSCPFRNGLEPSGTGRGYSTDLDYSYLSEGMYWIRAVAFDSFGRTAVDSHRVSIDPTPPDPVILSPENMDTVCHPVTLEAITPDENINLVRFMKKDFHNDYSVAISPIIQTNYGDTNDNPYDGNPATGGEFGEYYCGPTAAAMVIKYWFDQGYVFSMREGGVQISVDTVVERMAELMSTRDNQGTYDDHFYLGLFDYIAAHGNELVLDCRRQPDYRIIRVLFEEREQVLLLGVGGTPGVYLVLAGLSGLEDALGRYRITVADPVSGTLYDTYIRNAQSGSEIYYADDWHPLDIAFSVVGASHAVSRDLINNDFSDDDGWIYEWPSSDMIEDSLYYLTAMAIDVQGRLALATNIVQYGCGEGFTRGDYNGDGSLDATDIVMLINYVYKNGPPPEGGAHRADANCDYMIDISDVIYAIKYFYSSGPEPCY
jgi:hypothetical protein